MVFLVTADELAEFLLERGRIVGNPSSNLNEDETRLASVVQAHFMIGAVDHLRVRTSKLRALRPISRLLYLLLRR